MLKNFSAFLFLLTFTLSAAANTLTDFYHANHGPIERLVFTFNEYPRYRLRQDLLDLNVSFLDCGRNPEVQTEVFQINEVINRVTFVETDAFIGVLINSYDGYGLEHFIIPQEVGYKLVMDIFRFQEAPSPIIALKYAEFYEKVGLNDKAIQQRLLAEELQLGFQQEPIPQTDSLPAVQSPILEETDSLAAGVASQPVLLPEKPAAEPAPVPLPAEKKKFTIMNFIQKISNHKLLGIAVILTGLLVLVLLIFALIRRILGSRSSDVQKPSASFGTQEFQKVTIKRLLSNGWQVEDIARELNLTPEEVEHFGRSN